jgi:hypothetical protein
MNMRLLIAGSVLALSLGLATPGSATPGQDLVTASLRDQGFEVTLVHWTWLGRIRIIAVSDDIRREIVINPNTGEILRDYSQVIFAAATENDGHHNSDDSAAADVPVARLSDDVDASAMTALQEMSMGLVAPLVAEPGQ